MKFKYLISDMDGVLLDSEKMILDMYIKAANKLGFTFPINEFDKTIGVDIKGTKEILKNHIPVDFDALYDIREEMLVEFLTNNIPPIKQGVLEGLEKIQNSKLMAALATSTAKNRAVFRLHKTPILDYFKACAYGDEIINGKPAPDIFNLAAKRLSADNKDCIVLEDSTAGLMAAKAAGMSTILIPDMKQPDTQQKNLADYVATDFLDAVNYVLA